MREVPLRLDFRAASEEELALLLPLATTLPLHTLLLGAHHASGEALLRSQAVGGRSGGSLRRLAATLACTDTLQHFPALRELHLHAGAVERLYPSEYALVVGHGGLQRCGWPAMSFRGVTCWLPCVNTQLCCATRPLESSLV